MKLCHTWAFYKRRIPIALPQAAKVAETSLPTTEIVVGQNETRVSFAEWTLSENVEENSSVIVAVASVGTVDSEGVPFRHKD